MSETTSSPAAGQTPPSIQAVADIVIQLAVGAVFVLWAFRIISPFVGLIVWGGVIAIAIYPLFLKLADKIGGRPKTAATIIALIALAFIVLPVVAASSSLFESAQVLRGQIEQGTLQVPPPPPKVKEWPVIGEKANAAWTQASSNLQRFTQRYAEQIKPVVKRALAATASAGAVVLQLIASVLIAAVLLVNAKTVVAGIQALSKRIFGEDRGAAFDALAAQTVRSVATGVLGVAFVQAALAGIGMMIAGVPYAGVWSILVLFLAVMQLPPILVMLPVAIWVFGSAESQIVAIAFLVWAILVSASDAVLKPLFLGRGVEVPMLVILLGAIGGMMASGIIGLFVGAVVLALFYQLLIEWLHSGNEKDEMDTPAKAVES